MCLRMSTVSVSFVAQCFISQRFLLAGAEVSAGQLLQPGHECSGVESCEQSYSDPSVSVCLTVSRSVLPLPLH